MQRPAELFLEKFTTQQEDSLAKLHIVRSLAFFKSYPTLKNDIPYCYILSNPRLTLTLGKKLNLCVVSTIAQYFAMYQTLHPEYLHLPKSLSEVGESNPGLPGDEPTPKPLHQRALTNNESNLE